jgi:hypothetical protein
MLSENSQASIPETGLARRGDDLVLVSKFCNGKTLKQLIKLKKKLDE